MIRGEVFNIQRYCINDGPGIRTTVFLKGCPLDCLWCHNPEAKKRDPQILCRLAKCHYCGNCAKVCLHNCHNMEKGRHVLDFSHCVLCGDCISVCQAGALEVIGREYTAGEVVEIVRKDKIFYDNSGGGMTVSGGEPLMQPEFLAEVLRQSKNYGIHTAIETCGFASQKAMESVLEYTDLFLFDYKETNRELHRRYTGAYPERVLENLDFLHRKNKDVILRCPIVPGYNDRKDHFQAIAALAERYGNIKEVNLEPYHNLGDAKCEGLGISKKTKIAVPDPETVEMWKKQIAAMCNTVVK